MRPSKWGRRLDGSRRNAVKDAEYNPWKVPTEHRKYGEAQGRSGSGRGSLLCHYLESVTRIAANCHRGRAVVAEHPAMPHSPLTPRLATLNRDQLVALVERLVARHPDLADLAHLPLPGEAKRADGEGVRAHVTRILLTMGDDWRASSRAQYELFPIVAMADDYRNQGLLDDARIVYRAIIDAILAVYERIRDEESEIGGVVGDCIEGLGNCLDATSDSDLRTRLLRDAFEVYAWDTVAHGGYGMDGPPEKLLISRTTAPEKALVAGWIQAALTVPSGRPKYGAQYAGKLMLQLVGDQQDATSRESTYRIAGMDVELVDLLLAQGRTDDALAQTVREPGRERGPGPKLAAGRRFAGSGGRSDARRRGARACCRPANLWWEPFSARLRRSNALFPHAVSANGGARFSEVSRAAWNSGRRTPTTPPPFGYAEVGAPTCRGSAAACPRARTGVAASP